MTRGGVLPLLLYLLTSSDCMWTVVSLKLCDSFPCLLRDDKFQRFRFPSSFSIINEGQVRRG